MEASPSESVATTDDPVKPEPADDTPEEYDDPVEFLAAKGLKKSGANWLLAKEDQFRESLTPLSEMEKQLQSALKQRAKALQEIVKGKKQLADAEKQLRALQSRRQPLPPQLVEFTQKARQLVGNQEALTHNEALQTALREFSSKLTELQIGVLSAKLSATEMEERYKELKENEVGGICPH